MPTKSKSSPAIERLGAILGVDLPPVRVSSNTVIVTPEVASKLVAETSPRHQRESQSATIQRYAYAMRHGQWRLSTIRLGVVAGMKDIFSINGNHRLRAIVLAGDTPEFNGVEVQVEVVLCDSEDEIVALCVVEDGGKTRTSIDRDQIAGLQDELGLTRPEMNKLHAAINVLFQAFVDILPRLKSWDSCQSSRAGFLLH